VGAAGELGVARANQQEATAVVDVAAEKGRQLVEAAQLEAAALLDPAQAGSPRQTPAPPARRRTAKRDRRGNGEPSPVAVAS
jgi:hypothetical protein